MRMKTKALLASSVTIVLLLGVGVGIASAARPVIDGSCNCGCAATHAVNAPPFCHGSHPQDFARGSGNNAKWAGNCLAACLRNVPYNCWPLS